MQETEKILTSGERLYGFRILETVELQEFKALGIYARHEESGAELFHLKTEESENLFAFCFATALNNSTGAAHIVEHSVLCGSKNYPLKDPFIALAQGSLQTYLNAWTFPDKTVYPASSVNESDYFNLMSVYGDAVFRPKLEEWTFMQEGWRPFFKSKSSDKNADKNDDKNDGKDASLVLTGVVYNEMKGSYSNLEEHTRDWSVRSVLEGTVYGFDSGGDPRCIPDLSYEDFVSFHREKYSPANCKIFLAGNIDTKKQLAFLDEKFFSKRDTPCLASSNKAAEIPLVKRWDKPKTLFVKAPASAGNKANVFVSWLSKNDAKTNPEGLIALYALTEILFGHDGSPLLRTLVESPLGEDLAGVCGVEASLRETLWSAGLRGVKRGTKPEEVEALIFSELNRLVKEGIRQEDVESALLSLEFGSREIKRSGGPWSLFLLQRSLQGWMHGAKPWESMVFAAPFAAIKEKLRNNPRFFEELIENELLNNPHRALVTVQPSEDFLPEWEKELESKLKRMEASFSAEDRAKIDEKARYLEQVQSETAPPEALLTIPHIELSNLERTVEKIPRERLQAGALPIIFNRAWTNGISYFDFAFPLDVLEPEDYLYLPLFCHCAAALGTKDASYAEISSLLARTTGNFYAALHISPELNLAGGIEGDWLFFRLKCLDEKTFEAVKLSFNVIMESDFSDLRRLKDLIVELKNDFEASLAPNGSLFALSRASMRLCSEKAKSELLNGLSQADFIRKIEKEPLEKAAAALIDIKTKLLEGRKALVHITAAEEKAAVSALESVWQGFNAPPAILAPLSAAASLSAAPSSAAAAQNAERFFSLASFIEKDGGTETGSGAEVFSLAALQVGFAAVELGSSHYRESASVYEQALCHYLSTGPLWEEIRMKGGAYGARASKNTFISSFTFSTYRDPAPLNSLNALAGILRDVSNAPLSPSVIEKIIIGTYADLKQPKTAAQKGFADFVRFLLGIDEQIREQRLNTLIDMNGAALKEAALRMASKAQAVFEGKSKSPLYGKVIIDGKSRAKKSAKELGITVKALD